MRQADQDEATVTPEATAYHEAGHAAMALRVGRPLKSISIEHKGDAFGRMCYDAWDSDTFDPKYETSWDDRMNVERAMMVKLAGPAAEERFTGCPNELGASDDMAWFDRFASYVFRRSGVRPAYRDFVSAHVEDELNVLWPSVEAIANALLSDRNLAVAEAQALYWWPSMSVEQRALAGELCALKTGPGAPVWDPPRRPPSVEELRSMLRQASEGSSESEEEEREHVDVEGKIAVLRYLEEKALRTAGTVGPYRIMGGGDGNLIAIMAGFTFGQSRPEALCGGVTARIVDGIVTQIER